MIEKCLVTGGCGFIGVNLVRFLKESGAGVRVFDNLSGGSREDLKAVTDFSETTGSNGPAPEDVELIVGDIRDEAAITNAVKGVDAVVHLAAQVDVIESIKDPAFDCDLNVMGLLTVLQAVRKEGVKRFVFASSAAPLGDCEPPNHEEQAPRPLSPYGASKLTGEAYCSAFHGSYGLNSVSLRFSNVYGPYSFKKGSVVALFFRRALAGMPLVVYGDGSQTRDFIHVNDLCQAIVKASGSDAGGEVFQIATGVETSVNDLTSRIKTLVERDTKIKVNVKNEPLRDGEIYRSVSDISKARNMLEFNPSVSLEAGLEETWEWFKKRKAS